MPLYCPVENIEISSRPDWINQKVSQTFEANFWIIGESVIYSKPKGHSDFEGVKKSLALNDEVASFVSSGKDPYIQIEDYSLLKSSSTKARRYFIKKVNEDDRRKSIIFCNTTLPVNIAIKIGKQFNTTNKYIHVAKNYKDAVFHAKTLMNIKYQPLDPITSDILNAFNYKGDKFSPVELLSKEHWQIETTEFSNHAIVINNSLLHSTTTGFLRSQHLPLIDQMRYQCQSDLPNNSIIQYIIVNGGKLKGSSRSARIKMMQSLKDWHHQFPFQMYIPYKANLFTRTAFHMAKPLMPFKIKVAQNLEHALKLVQKDQQKTLTIETDGKQKKSQNINENDIENLLALIGNLDWAVEGIESPLDISPNHPFFYIYQSIKLIKEELDDLFAGRKQLESQLQQSQKMESIGRLAGGIAHDFNNILYMILGNAEIGLDEVTNTNPAYKALEEIKSASLRGAEIVKQLLNFSRKANLEIKPTNAVELIKDSLNFLRSSIPSSIEIHQKFEGNNISILADSIQMNQVIMNICTNASQAMEKDGGRITIKAKPIELHQEHVRYNSDLKIGLYYRIEISDTGPGIRPENIDKIFDPYYTTKEIGKGSGMGLAVVHGIIKKHKGTIMVDSNLQKGTIFTILLPQAIEKPKNERILTDKCPHGNERILFVDDEKALAEMGYRLLTRLGYKVEIYLDPEKALGMFSSNPSKFDLVISDMTMPKLNGAQLANLLKKERTDIPIILCTGHSSQIDEAKAKQIGIAAYIMKPVSMVEIGKTIREVLDN